MPWRKYQPKGSNMVLWFVFPAPAWPCQSVSPKLSSLGFQSNGLLVVFSFFLHLHVRDGLVFLCPALGDASAPSLIILSLILLLSHFPSLLLPPEPVPQPGFDWLLDSWTKWTQSCLEMSVQRESALLLSQPRWLSPESWDELEVILSPCLVPLPQSWTGPEVCPFCLLLWTLFLPFPRSPP